MEGTAPALLRVLVGEFGEGEEFAATSAAGDDDLAEFGEGRGGLLVVDSEQAPLVGGGPRPFAGVPARQGVRGRLGVGLPFAHLLDANRRRAGRER